MTTKKKEKASKLREESLTITIKAETLASISLAPLTLILTALLPGLIVFIKSKGGGGGLFCSFQKNKYSKR